MEKLVKSKGRLPSAADVPVRVFFNRLWRLGRQGVGRAISRVILSGHWALCRCLLAYDGIHDNEFHSNDPALSPVSDWNTVFIPYCDGGVHISESEYDLDKDGTIDRFHRGLRNTSAALDVAVRAFPSPRRILLAGVSAGGYGAALVVPLVRKMYPNIPIYVLNDSGVIVRRTDESLIAEQYNDYWNINAFYAPSCEGCGTDTDPIRSDFLTGSCSRIRI